MVRHVRPLDRASFPVTCLAFTREEFDAAIRKVPKGSVVILGERMVMVS